MKLSENRADAVRSYLVEQGVSRDSVMAKGFGKTSPVADNATTSGRQMNRRSGGTVASTSRGLSPDFIQRALKVAAQNQFDVFTTVVPAEQSFREIEDLLLIGDSIQVIPAHGCASGKSTSMVASV